MNTYQHGEIVDITIKGARIDEVVKNGIHVVMPNGTTASVELSNYDGVTVERIAPPEWPPQPGDLWRNRKGELWFAADVHDPELTDEADVVMVFPYENYREKPALLNHREGPLTLVRRESKQDVDVVDDDPKTWTDDNGHVWDLTAHYADPSGKTWHYAGGFGSTDDDSSYDGPLVPLLSRDDWSVQDVRITTVIVQYGPLTLVRREGSTS